MKLSTIEKISEVIPHPNADKLTIYKMVGMSWRVISGEKLNVGDLVIYIKTDTVVDKSFEEYSFLEKNKYRVNCIRLRGEYSNGLILPLGIMMGYLPESYYNVDPNDLIGHEVSEYIGVEKYIKPENLQSGDADGNFPTHILSKTDEERGESFPEIINQFKGKDCYVSIKADGSSCSVINHPDEGFYACSRNLKIKESENSIYWKPVFKYGLKEKLPVGYGLQMEVYGHGIQKNPEGLKTVDCKVFSVWNLNSRRLLTFDESIKFCEEIGIPFVDIFYRGEFKWESMDELVELSKTSKYSNGANAEGLVFRLTEPEFCDAIQKEASFKIINYNYKE